MRLLRFALVMLVLGQLLQVAAAIGHLFPKKKDDALEIKSPYEGGRYAVDPVVCPPGGDMPVLHEYADVVAVLPITFKGQTKTAYFNITYGNLARYSEKIDWK